MLAYVARRLLAAVPSLLVFAIGLFVLIGLAPPPPDVPAAEHARRFWHLPLLINLEPEDRPRVIARLVPEVADGDVEARAVALERLLRIGAAGLPDLVAALAALDDPARARVARALAPLAFRMGRDDVADLEVPQKAGRYWSRVLDDRGADLRPSSVRRTLRRHLGDRAEALYARQLREADTAALEPIFEELGRADPEHRADLETLAIAAARRAGVTEVTDAASLLAFWAAHRADYVELGSLDRVAARLTETRFGRWVVHAVTQRFGASWRTGAPVLDDLRGRASKSAARVASALLLAYAVALPLGIVTAARRFGPADRATQALLLALHAFPAFVLALVAQAASPRLARTDAFAVCALAIVALAPIARHVRSRLLEELRQDYVVTARAIGAAPWSLWLRAVLRNALGPVVAFAATQVPIAITATLLAEEILGLDGLGPAAIAAIRARDVPWLMAFALGVAVAATLALVIADLVQAVNDPRVRRALTVGRAEDA